MTLLFAQTIHDEIVSGRNMDSRQNTQKILETFGRVIIFGVASLNFLRAKCCGNAQKPGVENFCACYSGCSMIFCASKLEDTEPIKKTISVFLFCVLCGAGKLF